MAPTETLSVTVATETSIAVTYQIWIYSDENKTSDEVKAAVQAQLEALFAVAPVGGFKKTGDTDGKIWLNLLEATIKSVSKRAFQVEVSVPATDPVVSALLKVCQPQELVVQLALARVLVVWTPGLAKWLRRSQHPPPR